MDSIRESYATLRAMKTKQLALQFISLGLIASTGLILWRTLMLITGSESPVVVVLTGSMEPGFYRGDILFLNMGSKPIRTGDIVVFNPGKRDIPIVHRVHRVHERAHNDFDILTKGDANHGDDRALYDEGQLWLNKEHILGRVVGYLPYVGMVTIVMNDYPMLKYVLISVLGLLVVTSKE